MSTYYECKNFTSSILNQTSSCLCCRDPATRDHLLSCGYSSDIWSMVFLRISGSLQMFINLPELLAWIRSNQANNSNANIVSAPAATMVWKHRVLPRKMVTQAVVFHIWKQRNSVLHNNTSLTTSTIFHTIDPEIKNTISSRKNPKLFR